MSSLNKLAIRGIRSFDDKQLSVIEFFSPVTVIVGHNGSGKTTIIECLKYATTGDQPPNSRGGAFVHDPKIANEKEVKAQVKLRFHAANGTRMLAVRNLSVTVKKTGLTMKTLESILALADDNTEKGGRRAVISTKCAEMDTEIPQLLGVSKSVLENVIFCHQEDSYWPLAEPSVLKKKFDDIFEATRYTKALTSITALRKERTAEVKAERERLIGLSREKSRADQLRKDITELNNQIAAKEAEHEEVKKEHDALAESNRRFYEQATKFREIYVKVESLDARKQKLEEELAEAKQNVKEIPGTDEDLNRRLKNHDNEIAAARQKLLAENNKKEELQDALKQLHDLHSQLMQNQGQLQSEAKIHERRLKDREELIKKISDKYSIKGFSHGPLDNAKIIEFLSNFRDYQNRHGSTLEQLEGELQALNEDYSSKINDLRRKIDTLKIQKQQLRDQFAERQSNLNQLMRKLETQESLAGDLQSLQSDIEEQRARLEKVKADSKLTNYEARMAEKVEKSRHLEERRESLTAQLRALGAQADTRAKLELKQSEVKSKVSEQQTILKNVNARYTKLISKPLKVNNILSEAERLSAEGDRELSEANDEFMKANGQLQKAEASLSNLKSQLKTKREEAKAHDKTLKEHLGTDTLDKAIKDAMAEVTIRRNENGNMLGESQVYKQLLETADKQKICGACRRPFNDREMGEFKKHVTESLKNAAPDRLQQNKTEIREWEQELEHLQALRPVQSAWSNLTNKEIPALEKQVQEQEALIPTLSSQVETVSERVDVLKDSVRDIANLKQHGSNVVKLQKEIERAQQEIATYESELASTGSTKTTEDIQLELDEVGSEIRALDREKQALLTDRERQTNAVRVLENNLHDLELSEKDMKNEIDRKHQLEEQVEAEKKEITSASSKLRNFDSEIASVQAPLDAMEKEYQEAQAALAIKVQQARTAVEELNRSNDQLTQLNRDIERYVKIKGKAALEECQTRIEATNESRLEVERTLEATREAIGTINKEISSSANSLSTLRENIRIRRVMKDIADIEGEIAQYDMEEAAKARRNFESQYGALQERERALNSKFSHIAGEIGTLKSQLKKSTDQLKDYRNINKEYTEQLIKVKMSDMANNDLEKYAKALDHAIMKYHSLKMEEVNDTMRHLWNKTYQGTDIDGIKIRSDVEGGGTNKRSYNYRVVMTKDQVEMDMRGRCSAGQKMLASIIIRLALSDSFGQNCGILALDEPTNALDTENIDALADSLVDIINERKNHSNFQLIIITHDENFLRKLGQSEVMDYYWHVKYHS
ncbi:hypothetical protein AX16_008010 [Volvariella volvacea WC 439]|nr:hypothetical protein AX16_008010 [Volvariella volvacea WC 439]